MAAALGLSPADARAAAADGGSPLHSSGDRQLWHRQENRIELFGHASVSQPGETLTADYISLDLNNRVLDAKGNCVYVASGSVIYGDEMHFNLDTRTGTIVSGRVSNQQFTLSGDRLNKLSDTRFQTHRGEYSTCQDCPSSWSLMAEDVDMEVEGYAYMSGVTGKVADVPAFWLPYLVVPMKTRRQTGLLFPQFSFGSNNGFLFTLPFFWAINQSSDMTIGAGFYSKRGEKFEWEGRYALGDRSLGTANFNLLRDSSFTDAAGTPLPPNRWSLNVAQTQELPFGIEEKLRIQEVSDNLYPIKVGDALRNNDVTSAGELNLASSLSFAWANDDLSAYAAARWYRTLVYTNPDPRLQVTQFDPATVQAVPTAALMTRDRQLFGLPVVFGFNLGVTNFTRSRDAYDYDFSVFPYGRLPTDENNRPAYVEGYGRNPIRKATRLSFSPSLYTTLRPFDIFSFVPSIRYFGYYYSFPATKDFVVPNLGRDYVLLQADLSTQIERIFEYPDDVEHPRVKHLIRPIATYSYIPPSLVHENRDHPFLRQIRYAADRNIPGYYFDDYDIVPIDESPASTAYFVPLGNSLSLGLTTQWIRRDGPVTSDTANYTTYLEIAAGQSINFREYQKGSPDPHPLSRFFSTLSLNLERLKYSHTYFYYPYTPGIRHAFSAATTYTLDTGTHQGIYAFDRSLTLNYTWDQHGLTDLTKGTNNLTATAAYSLSDYILPSAYASYLFLNKSFQYAGVSLQFQSPSRCWKFTVSAPYQIEKKDFEFNFDLALNLTGSGYGGVSEAAASTGIKPL